ncbi:MAG: PepSY-like domain-containing protein [Chitinophagaceae bacterium]|nr:PepSY-like domain-containing protein [Chitinophagaceae bacterium]
MKKIFFFCVLFVGLTAIAQEVKPPAAAKSAFMKAYPAATKVKWEKENGAYEVTFVNNGGEMSAIYDAKGVLKESEHEIKLSELPAPVMTYMKAHYKGITVKNAAKITKADGSINYEAAIKGKDVLFDANGKFIKEAKD